MVENKSFRPLKTASTLSLIAIVICTAVVRADRPGWKRQQVDWRMTGGSKIKAIKYPEDAVVPTLDKKNQRNIPGVRKGTRFPKVSSQKTQELDTSIIANIVDSPPIDGFVPWIVVSVTDERSDFGELNAVPVNEVLGSYPAGDPQSDYAIGIFDTGASAHVMGNAAAIRAGLFFGNGSPNPLYLTNNIVTISGVTGSVQALVSQPLGLFVDGLGALDPGGLLIDTSGMVGETNVSIAVGQDPGDLPDLPTAIGSPLSVYFGVTIRNDLQITITHDGNDFTAPDMHFYDYNDPCLPVHANIIPLELRPLRGIGVQYTPSLEGGFPPASPSTVTEFMPSQSTFFVHSVDLTDGFNGAIDKDRFMFDTGAQVTVIGSRVGARLGLDHTNPEFEVEIQGVTGEITSAPGFYIDSIEIPALGEWISFTNVPVILLDIFSPEGGTLDGIIGMNLFVEFNMVFRGGGLFLQDDPAVSFEAINYRAVADIAPIQGDGVVDWLDLAALNSAWLATPGAINWDPIYDIAPYPTRDGKVDLLDFAVLAQYWLQDVMP